MCLRLILIDIGNTRFKWWYQADQTIVYQGALDSKDPDLGSKLKDAWSVLEVPEKVVVSNVAGEPAQKVVIAACAGWSLQPRFIQSAPEAFGLRNGYVEAHRLGVDRWLGLIGADAEYRRPFCVVDLGSAITADFVDFEGAHKGGLIVPGLQALSQALPFEVEGEESKIIQSHDVPWADRTHEALALGRFHLVHGFIEGILAAAEKEIKADLELILTGGDAPYVFPSLSRSAFLDLDLIRKGLERVALHGD